MPSAYYPKRSREYVYDVSVTKDETARLSRRYRASLSNAERIESGRLMPVPVDVPDTYGSSVSEAMRAHTIEPSSSPPWVRSRIWADSIPRDCASDDFELLEESPAVARRSLP